MIKLVAIDMDGTLLNSAHKLSQENIDAVRLLESSGIKVVLCTGRPLSGVVPYFKELSLDENSFAILNNGCSTFHTGSWELQSYHDIKSDDLAFLEKLTVDYPGIYMTLTTSDHYYVIGDTVPKIVQDDADLVFDTVYPIQLSKFTQNPEPVFKVMYVGNPSQMDIFQPFASQQLSQKFNTVRSQPYLFEVLPQGISKATGLQKLAKDLAISPENIMGIGDQLNDLEMLKYVGLGVAMGNAPEIVKKSSNLITDTNDNNGVAKIIAYILSCES